MEKQPTTPGIINLKRLEKKYKHMIECAYNFRQSDDSLSDIFYYEAEKVLNQLRILKTCLLSNQ